MIWHFGPASSGTAIEGRGLSDHEFESAILAFLVPFLLVWNLDNDRPPACKIEEFDDELWI